MNLLDRLFRKRPNPTLGWNPGSQTIPDFDLVQMCFGSLHFGDSLESAAFLGRPESFEWLQDTRSYLLYATRGFCLEFDSNKFDYLSFFIGADDFIPKHPLLKFSKPRLRGSPFDNVSLSGEADRSFVEQVFGFATTVDADSDETILYYHRQKITMEFELGGLSGQVKRWSLYPTKIPPGLLG